MEYKESELVKDFAQRTKRNLELLRRLQQENDDLEVYETTQLMNSLLGLLVFPQQRCFDRIPETSLNELIAEGWPIPRLVGDFSQARDLKQLVRYLRNAIAHFNIEFIAHEGELAGLTVWNIDPRSKKTTWKAQLSFDEIEVLVEKFIALILEMEPRQDVQ